METAFTDAGWDFPVRVDAAGGVALVGRERRIAQSLRLILGTAPGERPMRPEFGCAIHDLVFAPADTTTASRIAFEVRRSVERWEPHVDLHDVVVGFDDADRGTLLIDLRYTVRGTPDPRSLVFPLSAGSPDGAARDDAGGA